METRLTLEKFAEICDKLGKKFEKEQELSDEEIKEALKEIIEADEDLRGKKGIEEFFIEFMHLLYPECSVVEVEEVMRLE
jgi:hypothetical protein